MKRNTHVIVPDADFRLVQGGNVLTTYQFGTKTARHLFCSSCGICPFYVPRSNPDAYAVTLACIDPGTIQSTEVRHFDGQNWEQAVPASGIMALFQSAQPQREDNNTS